MNYWCVQLQKPHGGFPNGLESVDWVDSSNPQSVWWAAETSLNDQQWLIVVGCMAMDSRGLSPGISCSPGCQIYPYVHHAWNPNIQILAIVCPHWLPL